VNPVCIPACPVNVIAKREEDGIVVVDSDACVGNKECDEKCRKACPYDAPQFDEGDGAKMKKCHFCPDRLQEGKIPSCVEACPTRALDAGDIDELKAKYGATREAEAFKYSNRVNPSVIFKAKISS
jgi:anaerobic dimethyl sulfoxide reductase subunit B (iron-sulfur subunit)